MVQQDFLIIFFDLVRQSFLLRFFDKFFVEKYYIKIVSNYNATTFFFAKKQHKFSTKYAKILPHFSHRLEVFGEICRIMSKKIVLYSVFRQDFSARFFANIRHKATTFFASPGSFCRIMTKNAVI